MATLKSIRQRIKTAKNIRQITRAMKLVAAARLNKAKTRVEEARPYSEKMREFIAGVGGAGTVQHPLLDRRPIRKALVVLVTSDRGLAGSYNTALIRRAGDWLGEQTVPTPILAVGKKGAQFFGKRGVSVVETISVPTAGAGLDDAVRVTKKVREMFESGEVDAVYLCYSKFYSPIRQEPQMVQLLPIEPPAGAETPAEYVFEPAPAELLGLILPKYLLTVVYQALLESSASEHGARMTAMSNATDNAGKMIDSLTLTANRVRQASITTEILEIVAGAEALKN